MTIAERSYGSLWHRRIRCGQRYELLVENRDLYTRYRIQSRYTGQTLLWHDVRTPEPLPIRPAQIINARHIPWFMWIIFAIRDWHRQRIFNRELEEWAEEDEARREAIRKAVDQRGLGRFPGRYNR